MIYYDPPRIIIFREVERIAGHFAGNDLDELHQFMEYINVPFRAFHDKPRRPHYDLFDDSIIRAHHAGAIQLSRREFIEFMRSIYGE